MMHGQKNIKVVQVLCYFIQIPCIPKKEVPRKSHMSDGERGKEEKLNG